MKIRPIMLELMRPIVLEFLMGTIYHLLQDKLLLHRSYLQARLLI